ncbi:hypothetical protein BGM26_06810 [Bacillus sp. FJAT-29790]|uniref:hypothetical protein n=1 Tax=Bacillus sp. FJAT-29790 TaxID=1895002 RepID=UPI001C218FCA|nr:hypothetical protein [Bacillus sp. FJAT-29790]MBU8878699.1 hypothetical protein [Bacillus sp. FJAT-29790]
MSPEPPPEKEKTGLNGVYESRNPLKKKKPASTVVYESKKPHEKEKTSSYGVRCGKANENKCRYQAMIRIKEETTEWKN